MKQGFTIPFVFQMEVRERKDRQNIISKFYSQTSSRGRALARIPMQTSLAEKAARKVEKSSARLPYACFVK